VWAFHPGSGSPRKNWPLSEWQKIVREAISQGFEPLLIAGETEREREKELRSLWYWQARELPLPHLAAVLEGCASYLGHDSGVSHLAAAVGVRTGVLFGATDSVTWAPPGSHVTVFTGGEDWGSFTAPELFARLSVREA
jgi:heptosyltransferase III